MTRTRSSFGNRMRKALAPLAVITLAVFALQGCLDNPTATEKTPKDQARLDGNGKPMPTEPTSGCAPGPDCPIVIDTGTVCAQVVVCGADGKLYGDPCSADKAGVKYSYDLGACKEVPIDPVIPPIGTPDKPWCGTPDPTDPPVLLPTDPVLPVEPIEDGWVCTADYSPVCGVNGKTYSNACMAAGSKVEVAYQGVCK
jgi:hypothetical protein